jgi:HEAT repeat protein
MVELVHGDGTDSKRALLAMALLQQIDLEFAEFMAEPGSDGSLPLRIMNALSLSLREGTTQEHREAVLSLARVAPTRLLEMLEKNLGHTKLLETVIENEVSSGASTKLLVQCLDSFHLQPFARSILISLQESAVSPLISIVEHGTDSAQQAAIEILGAIGDRQAVPTLLAKLKETDETVEKSRIIAALGRIGDPEAIEPLVLDTGDDIIHFPEVTRAIGQMGEPGIRQLVDLLGEGAVLALYASKALVDIGASAVELLNQTLKHRNLHVRAYAAKTLGNIGSIDAVESLGQAMRDREMLVQWEAIDALSKLGEPAVAQLIAILPYYHSGSDDLLYERAIEALVKIGTLALDQLLVATRHEPWPTRKGVVLALGQIGDQSTFVRLRELLESDAEQEIRQAAAEALGLLGDPRAVEPLRAARDSSQNFAMKLEATFSLARLGHEPSKTVLYSIVENGTSVMTEAVLNEHNDLLIRHHIANTLVEFEDLQVLPYLELLLQEIGELDYPKKEKLQDLSFHRRNAEKLLEHRDQRVLPYLEKIIDEAEAIRSKGGDELADAIRELASRLEDELTDAAPDTPIDVQ